MNEYSNEYISTNFGKVELLSVQNITAGVFAEFQIQITIGKFGLDDGGHIKIAWPVSSAFGIPQFDNPTEINYTSIVCSQALSISAKYEGNGYIRPFMPCITIKFTDGYLVEGDIISVILGDQSKGSKGIRTQAYVEDNIEFKTLLDPFGTNKYQRLPDSPRINIIPDKPAKLFAISKSTVAVDTPTWLVVRADDHYGNTAIDYRGSVAIVANNQEIIHYKFTETDLGIKRFENLTFKESGIIQLSVIDEENKLQTLSNPIVITEIPQKQSLYWGDLHGQTGETVGSGTIEQYFKFGKDAAAIDFIAHAANAFQVTKAIWKKLRRVVEEYYEPNRLVTYLGYEWSGLPGAGGDHNVYYLQDNPKIFRCSHALIDDLTDLDTDRYPIAELYKEFQGRDDVMIIPHIGGRKASLDVIDENLTPFIEICSVHGHFEWFIHEALDRELKVGFIGSSDTHSTRPGDTVPVSNIEAVRSGLTAVYAEELTREALWKAFKARHVYATTGERIILKFMCEDALMGDEIITNNLPKLNVEVIGTAGIEKVEIYREKEKLYSYDMQEGEYHKSVIGVRWTGARIKNRRRNAKWSGSLRISDGKFIKADPFAFDLPWEGITEFTHESITFNSTTAGDYDGIIIEFEGDENSVIHFESEIINYKLQLKDLNRSVIIPAGGVGLALEIFRVPITSRKTDVSFTYIDKHPITGMQSYYVKVLQEDGEKAWSSPIFITYNE